MTSRADIVIRGSTDRADAVRWINHAPLGSRVIFKGPQRNTDQNAKLWACLTDIARQVKHGERRYTADQWKVLFLHACGREVQFLQALDGSTFVPYGHSSSDLSVTEMSELLDFIMSFGAEQNPPVVWSDPTIRELEEQGT